MCSAIYQLEVQRQDFGWLSLSSSRLIISQLPIFVHSYKMHPLLGSLPVVQWLACCQIFGKSADKWPTLITWPIPLIGSLYWPLSGAFLPADLRTSYAAIKRQCQVIDVCYVCLL